MSIPNHLSRTVPVCYAALTKKEAVGQKVPRAIFKKKTHSNASVISVSDLLDIVKKLDQGIWVHRERFPVQTSKK